VTRNRPPGVLSPWGFVARSAEPRPFRWNQKRDDIPASIQRFRWRTIDVLPWPIGMGRDFLGTSICSPVGSRCSSTEPPNGSSRRRPSVVSFSRVTLRWPQIAPIAWRIANIILKPVVVAIEVGWLPCSAVEMGVREFMKTTIPRSIDGTK
jgi:hypothetical protein